MRVARKKIAEALTENLISSQTTGKVPLFRKGTRAKLGNHKLLDLTSTAGKLLERIDRDKDSHAFGKERTYCRKPAWICVGRSCLTNLIELFGKVMKMIDEGRALLRCSHRF